MENLNKKWYDYLLIVTGTWMMGLAVNIVYEPMNLVTGGVSGLAIVVKSLTGPLIPGGIPIWLTNACVNVPLFAAAFHIKGKNFVRKTLFATVSFTVALYMIPVFEIAYQDYLLASVFGGLISGVGLGLVFSTGASTGGTDLFGSLMQHYARHYSVAQLLFVADSVIVLAGAVVFGVNKALYAVIAVYITSKIMDGILEGLKFAKLAFIISDHADAIAGDILHTLDRGVTAVSAQGGYSGREKQMLLCVVSKKEVVKLIELIRQIDPKAFLIVSDARDVMGEGFIEYRQ